MISDEPAQTKCHDESVDKGAHLDIIRYYMIFGLSLIRERVWYASLRIEFSKEE